MNNRKILSVISILLMLSLSLCFFSCASKPSEKTFKEVQRASVEELVKEINKGYDKLDKVDYTNTSMKTDISISLSNEVLTMLRSSSGEDMTWLNDLNISMLTNYKGKLASVNLGLNYKTNSLLALEAIMNLTSNDAYLAIPVLTSKVLKLDLGDADIAAVYDPTNNAVLELMPDKEVLGRIILKYYDIVMAAFTNISFTEGTLTVDDVTEECIVYTASLSRGQVMTLALNILETVKADQDIHDYVKRVDAYAAENELSEESIYDEFVKALDENIAEAKAEDPELFNDTTEAVKWTSYMTKDNEILANAFELIGEEESYSLFIGKAQNGENIALNAYLKTNGETTYELEGKLTEVKGKQSGTYEISVEGESMLFVDVADLDTKKLEDGLISGSFTLCPSKGLIDMITENAGGDAVSAGVLPGLAIASFSLKIDVDQKSDRDATFDISLLNSGSPYVSLTVSTEVSEGKEIKLPAENNVSVSTEEWAAEMDLNAFIENLENSGLPSFVVELISQYIMPQYDYAPY